MAKTRPEQIIALGGGGFSMEPDNLRLDRYILEQAGVKRPRVCFIGTATGDSDRYLANFYTAFSSLDARPSHLPLFKRTPDIRGLLLNQDVLYAGGGNTVSMLAVWRVWGLPEVLAEAWHCGIILAGISAGAMCWFEVGISKGSGKARRAATPAACPTRSRLPSPTRRASSDAIAGSNPWRAASTPRTCFSATSCCEMLVDW